MDESRRARGGDQALGPQGVGSLLRRAGVPCNSFAAQKILAELYETGADAGLALRALGVSLWNHLDKYDRCLQMLRCTGLDAADLEEALQNARNVWYEYRWKCIAGLREITAADSAAFFADCEEPENDGRDDAIRIFEGMMEIMPEGTALDMLALCRWPSGKRGWLFSCCVLLGLGCGSPGRGWQIESLLRASAAVTLAAAMSRDEALAFFFRMLEAYNDFCIKAFLPLMFSESAWPRNLHMQAADVVHEAQLWPEHAQRLLTQSRRPPSSGWPELTKEWLLKQQHNIRTPFESPDRYVPGWRRVLDALIKEARLPEARLG
ncbi:hypothetical protein DFJ74DRAFT_642203 [Hyaloraphidium curvatum]|nr:hypothetical protein DFJ74DRAFT_642203 [Hyaloraphidium curvatum]